MFFLIHTRKVAVSKMSKLLLSGLLGCLSGLGSEFMIVSEIPRQNGFDGESRVVADAFPRQSGFGGFSDRYLS